MDHEIFRVASDAWQAAVDRKDLHAAIDAGIASYLVCRNGQDQKVVAGSLNLIDAAIWLSLQKGPGAGALSCSFCGRPASEVRLAAGPHAFICADCVATFGAIIARTPPE